MHLAGATANAEGSRSRPEFCSATYAQRSAAER